MSDGLFFVLLGIVGMGAIFGGIVFYRGSTTTGKRAMGAALTAVGAFMLVALGILVPVSSSSS